MMIPRPLCLVAVAALTLTGCARRTASGEHDDHAAATSGAAATAAVQPTGSGALPPSNAAAPARLASSNRRAEWAMIRTGPSDSVAAWVVYPERSAKAPVVIVIHEIFGLSSWIRGVADQLAADGFIAIAPDLLTMKRAGNLTSEWSADSARSAIRTLQPADVHRQLDAVARYGMALPAALPKYGVVGFCWGGSTSFAHAVHAPTLGAAVVYYGSSPPSSELTTVRAPVLGLYGGNDARVNATIPSADSTMTALGKTYDPKIFAGAGHGFLRQQEDSTGANAAATRQAWPQTLAWFRQYLGS